MRTCNASSCQSRRRPLLSAGFLFWSATILWTQKLAVAFNTIAHLQQPFLQGSSLHNANPLSSLPNRQISLLLQRDGDSLDDKTRSSEGGRRNSRFGIRKRVRAAVQNFRSKSYDDDDISTTTWSRSSTAAPRSRFGVRKRVKKVLAKAKSRTGIRNNSEPEAALWVAEAASIGALTENSDLIIKSRLSLSDVAGNKNGSTSNGATRSNGATSPTPIDLDELDLSDGTAANGDASRKDSPEVDGIRADVPTALPEPLPFNLPTLSEEQKQALLAGERIQEQSKMGREGAGYVVVDVKAPPEVIWESLLDFENYPELIKTVRSMNMLTNDKLTSGYHSEKPVQEGWHRELRHCGIPSVTRAVFILSKFKLNIAAIHNYRPHPAGDYMVFNLDPECTNLVLKSATGIWHTQANPDGRGEEYTRVWLLCDLKVSQILPVFIVDYAAKRAMPRATTWLKPHVEETTERWAAENKARQS